MGQTLAVAVCAAGFAAMGFAQNPVITEVLDAGEYSAGVAPGSVFVVKGTNLSAAGYTPAPGLPLGTTLANVKVTFTRLNVQTPIDAYMVYTYNQSGVNQLAAVLPSSVTPGDYNVTVTNGAAVSANFRTSVVSRKYRMITQDASGSGAAVIQNFISQAQLDVGRLTTGTLGGFTFSPTHPRQPIVIWGTGFGAISGIADNVAPGAQDFRSQVTIIVYVGGVAINPDYAGRAPSLPGTDQINVTLPANVPTGCSVSLQVSVAGQLSNPTTIAIAGEGSDACVSPTYSRELLSRLDAGGTITVGAFTLTSSAAGLTVPGLGTFSGTVELSAGGFSRYTGAQISAAAPFANQIGTCQLFRRVGSPTDLLLGKSDARLDAGANLALAGPGLQASATALARGEKNDYYLALGTSVPGIPIPLSLSPVVSAGNYTLRGTGGADIGAFNASLTIGSRITVEALPATINRGQGLTVTWSGGASDLVHVVGISGTRLATTTSDLIYDAGVFLCTAQTSSGRLTVPGAILNQLPATPANALTAGTGIGIIAVLSSAAPTQGNGLFTAPLTAGGNIDVGVFLPTVGSLALTQYQ